MGPTKAGPLKTLVEDFGTRIGRYLPFEWVSVPDVRSKGRPTPDSLKELESEALLRHLEPGDQVVLLDENGASYSSRKFASQLQKWMNAGPKRLVLVIGGAYGFGSGVRSRADAQLSLSRMTFNHQVVRLMAAEQLYRALTILRGEPYHND